MRALDLSTLDGCAFACRPACGLCCFASPAIAAEEARRLVQILPSAERFLRSGHVLARGDGGACRLLDGARCRGHKARPFACVAYPLTVHLGERAQATAVLTCPGFSWRYDAGERAAAEAPEGLDLELAAVRDALAELDEAQVARARRAWRRALAALGTLEPLATHERAEARQSLEDLGTVRPADDGLPSESDGLETLPLFHDAEFGVVALSGDGDRVDLLQLREGGGVAQRLATLALPESRPTLDDGGRRVLTGYRDLLLARDATVGAAALRAIDAGETTLVGALVEDVRATLGTALARAIARAQLHGLSGVTLDAAATLEGVRATDADALDRPTVGRWL